MDSFKYVIIGGGIAAGRACEGIRRVDPKGTLALIAAEAHLPYQRPPLSKGYLLGKEGLDQVYLREESFYSENAVATSLGVRATRIDRAAHRIALGDGRVLGYEKLLLATGAQPLRLPLPGADLDGVLVLRTLEDSERIRAGAGQRVLVVGGSFIGAEVASSLAQLGATVTMVFPDGRLLARVASPELSIYLHNKYAAHEVRIISGAKPQRLEGNGKVSRAVLDNGETLDVDMVVMGVGVRLDTELARDADLSLGDRGAILVDEYLRTSDADIYAAGDIASWPDSISGRRLRVEHWDVARRQGQRAGRNMAGETKPFTDLPYFFSDLFDISFEVWGDLTAWQQVVWRGTLKTKSYALYYFDQGRLCGVLASGRPDAEQKPSQALIKARSAYDDVATKLQDENIDLGAWAG